MADKKKEKEKSKATIRGTVSSPTKDQAEFPPMPPESQLNDRFEKLMVRISCLVAPDFRRKNLSFFLN
jgi:hypothetical protein